jgi:AraC-like DNA-binding protein
MAAIAALLESRHALQALRRGLPRGGPTVVACRGTASLERVFASRLVEAVVLAPHEPYLADWRLLRERFPGVPIIVYAAFRPDDGELLLECDRQGVAAVLVEGVDDGVAGEVVTRCSATAERRRALHDAPRVLRLTSALQRAAWNTLIDRADRPIRTAELARRLRVSREHLSRQFGAGDAPNLKRAIDLIRIAAAAQLLRNPGIDIRTAAKILHFASSGHLSATSRRIANVSPSGLPALGPRGVLGAFVRGNMRSRAA